MADGYVTGLEPATDYPNGKAFERSKGRLINLLPGETHSVSLQLEVLTSGQDVINTQNEIDTLQQQQVRIVHPEPIDKYSDI